MSEIIHVGVVGRYITVIYYRLGVGQFGGFLGGPETFWPTRLFSREESHVIDARPDRGKARGSSTVDAGRPKTLTGFPRYVAFTCCSKNKPARLTRWPSASHSDERRIDAPRCRGPDFQRRIIFYFTRRCRPATWFPKALSRPPRVRSPGAGKGPSGFLPPPFCLFLASTQAANGVSGE